MSTTLKIFLSMSFSGSLLILVLLFGRRFFKDKISRQWQYYIWLVVVFRLLFPFGSEVNLLGKTYQAIDYALTQTTLLPPQTPMLNTSEDTLAPVVDIKQNNENMNDPVENLTIVYPFQEIVLLLSNHVWLVWLIVALGLLIRKITIYQGFTRFIHVGLTPVCDIEILDQFFIIAEQLGIKKSIDLCVNPLISSPLLFGFVHPCVVLPNIDIPEKDFRNIVLHELTHYKRRDMFYKWLVQITVCLHWYNPLVYLMSREITKACEFSCDEAVLAKFGNVNAQDYGKTLLDAMAAVGKYKENLGVVTLSENKQLLKERLGAIMDFKRKSKTYQLLTGVLTLCMIFGAAFVGIYPTAAASNESSSRSTASGDQDSTQVGVSEQGNKDYASLAERYYEADSLPLFEIVFSRLDESTQKKWIEKLYIDEDVAFFSIAVRGFDGKSSLFADVAEKVYADKAIAFFSILTDCMDEAELEFWLNQALEDEDWAFQSMLFDKLDRGDAFDEIEEKREKELEEAQAAKYRAVGVTMDGKNYYYQGQLANIFMDIRPNKSFYTLNINPKGIINIKIVRGADNEIIGVAYMTEEEVAEVLEDMIDDDDEWEDNDWMDNDWMEITEGKIWHPHIVPVDLETVVAGETIFLGEYTLSDGDTIWYDISAETGNRMKVFFAKDEQKNVVYWSAYNLRQSGKSLRCVADFTVGPPTKPGTYKLYLQAPDDALGNVKGNISIGFITDES